MPTWSYRDYLEPPSSADPGEPASWPPDIHALLDEIRTIEALDILCAVAREPFRPWRISELPGAHGSDSVSFTEAVLHLIDRGLIARNDDGGVQFGATGTRTATVHALCRLCDVDRPNVLGAIAQLCIGRVRAIAARTLVGGSPRSESDDPNG